MTEEEKKLMENDILKMDELYQINPRLWIGVNVPRKARIFYIMRDRSGSIKMIKLQNLDENYPNLYFNITEQLFRESYIKLERYKGQQMKDQHSHELAEKALDQAIRNDCSNDADTVLKDAEKFYQFLTGNHNKGTNAIKKLKKAIEEVINDDEGDE